MQCQEWVIDGILRNILNNIKRKKKLFLSYPKNSPSFPFVANRLTHSLGAFQCVLWQSRKRFDGNRFNCTLAENSKYPFFGFFNRRSRTPNPFKSFPHPLASSPLTPFPTEVHLKIVEQFKLCFNFTLNFQTRRTENGSTLTERMNQIATAISTTTTRPPSPPVTISHQM